MGYSTDFTGKFSLDKPLKAEHAAYLRAFAETRRMGRDAKIAETLPDPLRKAAGLPIGVDGAYFVGSAGSGSVFDYNRSAMSQPGLWCQWVPNADGTAIEWDGGEKFYSYVKWIEYLIKHFLAPWGYVLNGAVEWSGEDAGDIGKIVIKDNKVKVLEGRIVYGDESEDES